MIEVHPVLGLGEIGTGVDLGSLLSEAFHTKPLKQSDFIVVTQKIISKAEGRMVALADITPGPHAVKIAGAIGKDPRLVELALAESTEIVRAAKNVLITRHKLGLVMANSGIDCSNLGPGHEDSALLLPVDPDASAKRIADTLQRRFGVRPGVVISDSFGRPWRHGVVNVAIGCDGVTALHDKRGDKDRDGRVMQATLIAYGDLIASAAGLVMGEAEEGVPAALIRGLKLPGSPRPATALVRAPEEDLFR